MAAIRPRIHLPDPRLKAERVQEPILPPGGSRQDAPLVRRFEFDQRRTANLFVAFVDNWTADLGFAPEIRLSRRTVELRLRADDDRQRAFAHRLRCL